jgi:hypothetical protein
MIGPMKRLTLAAQKAGIKDRVEAQKKHFDTYGYGYITQEVYGRLPIWTKILYKDLDD